MSLFFQGTIASPSQLSPASLTQQSTDSVLQRSSVSPLQLSIPSDSEGSEKTGSPTTCFVNQKQMKRRKIDPMETAFCRINTTLNSMAMQVSSRRNEDLLEKNDPDVLIGNLVTAELKKTMEPKKSMLKKKFMEMLYSSDN